MVSEALEVMATRAMKAGRLRAWADETAPTLTLVCARCGTPIRTVMVADWLWAYYGQLPSTPMCSIICYRLALGAAQPGGGEAGR
jgi:hypothetical protein